MNVDKENLFLTQCHAYFDGAMSLDEQAAFLTLASSDEAYQITFQKYQKLHQLLRNEVEVEPSAKLSQRILQAVSQEPQEISQKRLYHFPTKWRIPLQAVAGFFLVAVVGFAIYGTNTQPTQINTPTMAVKSHPTTTASKTTPEVAQLPSTPTTKTTHQTAASGETVAHQTTSKAISHTPEVASALPHQTLHKTAQNKEDDAALEKQMEDAWDMSSVNHQQMASLEDSADWADPSASADENQ